MNRLEKFFVNHPAKGRANIRRVQERLDLIEGQPIQDVVEVGCGVGMVSAFLAETRGLNVTGTDFDPEQIEIARRIHGEHDRLRFQVEDAAQLTFGDQAFDLAIAQDVMHHIPNWESAIQELARVLRPRGHLILDDLAITAVEVWLARRLGRERDGFTLSDLRDSLTERAFQIRSEIRSGWGPFGRLRLLLQRV